MYCGFIYKYRVGGLQIILEYLVKDCSSSESSVLYADSLDYAFCAELPIREPVDILIENYLRPLAFQIDSDNELVAASEG